MVVPPSLPQFEISWLPDAAFQKVDAVGNSAKTAPSPVAVKDSQYSLVQQQTAKPAAAKQGAVDKVEPAASVVTSAASTRSSAPVPAIVGAAATSPASTGTAAKGAGATGVAGEAPLALNAPRVEWPFPEPSTVKRLAIRQVLAPTPEQSAYALKRGRAILAPYLPATTRLRVVFEVPVGEQIGVMMFDGAQDDLAATTVFILDEKPQKQAWIEIDALKAYVVGE